MTNDNHERPTTLETVWIYRWDLFWSTRDTVMLYALACTVMGYHIMHLRLPPAMIGLNALAFALVTGNIMMFNDIVDRFHDVKKGKRFAHDHPTTIRLAWRLMSAFIAILLIALSYQHALVATFCAGVWWLGLAYSFVPHWYIAQNALVAACSASPVLCGLVVHGHWNSSASNTAMILFGMIFLREITKDIEDVAFDPGYKASIPVVTAQDTPIGWKPFAAFLSGRILLWWDSICPTVVRVELVKTIKICGCIIAAVAADLWAFLEWRSLATLLTWLATKPALVILLFNIESTPRPAQMLIDASITIFLVTLGVVDI